MIKISLYIYTQNIWSFVHTKTKKKKNAHQRGSVLKDDIWQDFTEHESKFELVDDGIESKEKINLRKKYLKTLLEFIGRFHFEKAKRSRIL